MSMDDLLLKDFCDYNKKDINISLDILDLLFCLPGLCLEEGDNGGV